MSDDQAPAVLRFATAQTFGGVRASLGGVIARSLPEGFGERLCAELIGSINEHDEPCADLLGEVPIGAFVATQTEADVLAMPPGSWTWLPKIGGAS